MIAHHHPRYSLILIEPKDAFFGWLESYAASQGLEMRYFPYYKEENSAYLVPVEASLRESKVLETLIEDLKPVFLRAEIGRFVVYLEALSETVADLSFDDLFSIEIRDEVTYLEQIPGVKEKLEVLISGGPDRES